MNAKFDTTEGTENATPLTEQSASWVTPLVMAIGLFLALRLALSLLAWASLIAFPLSEEWWACSGDRVMPVLRRGGPIKMLSGSWQRWDALWFERIAAGGYRTR